MQETIGKIVELRCSVGRVPGLDAIVSSSHEVKDCLVRFINFRWEEQIEQTQIPPFLAQRLLESMVDLLRLEVGGSSSILNLHFDP